MDRILHLLGSPLPPRRAPWVVPVVVVGLVLGGLSGVAAATVVPRATEPEPADATSDPDPDRPVQPEDVGARLLELLADQLEQGAAALEQKADDRYARRRGRIEERPDRDGHGPEIVVSVRSERRPAPPSPPTEPDLDRSSPPDLPPLPPLVLELPPGPPTHPGRPPIPPTAELTVVPPPPPVPPPPRSRRPRSATGSRPKPAVMRSRPPA